MTEKNGNVSSIFNGPTYNDRKGRAIERMNEEFLAARLIAELDIQWSRHDKAKFEKQPNRKIVSQRIAADTFSVGSVVTIPSSAEGISLPPVPVQLPSPVLHTFKQYLEHLPETVKGRINIGQPDPFTLLIVIMSREQWVLVNLADTVSEGLNTLITPFDIIPSEGAIEPLQPLLRVAMAEWTKTFDGALKHQLELKVVDGQFQFTLNLNLANTELKRTFTLTNSGVQTGKETNDAN
jgi:hypothetical protein